MRNVKKMHAYRFRSITASANGFIYWKCRMPIFFAFFSPSENFDKTFVSDTTHSRMIKCTHALLKRPYSDSKHSNRQVYAVRSVATRVFCCVDVIFLLLIYLKANKWFEDPLLFYLVSLALGVFSCRFFLSFVSISFHCALSHSPALCIHGIFCLLILFSTWSAKAQNIVYTDFFSRLFFSIYLPLVFSLSCVQLKRRVYFNKRHDNTMHLSVAYTNTQQHAGNDK